jgi:hypothetical protein
VQILVDPRPRKYWECPKVDGGSSTNTTIYDQCRQAIRTVGRAFTHCSPSWGYPTSLKEPYGGTLRGRGSVE